jgi:hypothetical protein
MYFVTFDGPVSDHAIIAGISRIGGGATTAQIAATLCGDAPQGTDCGLLVMSSPNSSSHNMSTVLVNVQNSTGENLDQAFYVQVSG